MKEIELVHPLSKQITLQYKNDWEAHVKELWKLKTQSIINCTGQQYTYKLDCENNRSHLTCC